MFALRFGGFSTALLQFPEPINNKPRSMTNPAIPLHSVDRDSAILCCNLGAELAVMEPGWVK